MCDQPFLFFFLQLESCMFWVTYVHVTHTRYYSHGGLSLSHVTHARYYSPGGLSLLSTILQSRPAYKGPYLAGDNFQSFITQI